VPHGLVADIRCGSERRSTCRCGAESPGHRPSRPRGPLQSAERDARYSPNDGAFTAAVEDWRAGGDHARAEGPAGTGGRSVEPPVFGASIAVGIPVYRSAA
jgi:hypothetical protein